MATQELRRDPLKDEDFRRFLTGPYVQYLVELLDERKTYLFRKIERPSPDVDVVAMVNRIQGASDALDFIRSMISEAKKEK